MIEDITSAQVADEIATIDRALWPIRGFLATMHVAELVLGVI